MVKAAEQQQDPVRKMPGVAKLKSLCATNRRVKQNVAEMAGELGSEIKEIVEKFGTDRAALRMFLKADGMEPERLRRFRDDFLYLFDAGGLNKRADAVQPMPFEEPGEDEGVGGDPPKERNVAPFPRPSSVPAE
jgi:hypothetical protein